MRAFLSVLLGLLLLVSPPALALEPDEVLDDPVLEQRARDLSRELRCLVCQNESIDDSPAPLARDLRILVRERLVAGDTNAEVLAFVRERYGDYVLMTPPVQANTGLLWAAPLLVLIAGIGLAIHLFRAHRLSAEDAAGD